ncbi:TMEM175 family protein [Streptomyces libani]
MVNGGRRVRDDEGSAVRLLALSDGVFAIAMTLLALDISLPDGLDSDGFAQALRDVMPKVWAYALSLLVIAAFWRGHYQLFQYVRDVDGTVIRLVLLSLGLVALMPFPTTLLAEYGDLPQSVAIYSGAVAVMGATQLALTLVLWKRPWLGERGIARPHRAQRHCRPCVNGAGLRGRRTARFRLTHRREAVVGGADPGQNGNGQAGQASARVRTAVQRLALRSGCLA